MTIPKINDRKLLRLIDKDKMSPSAAARQLGVSRQAVHQRLQELRGKTTKAIVAAKIDKVVDANFDAIKQLHDINNRTLHLLDEAEENPELSLKCISEVRNQIRLAADIYEKMYSVQVVNDFMQTIIDVLKNVDADAYRKFKKQVNEHRSLRSVLRFVG